MQRRILPLLSIAASLLMMGLFGVFLYVFGGGPEETEAQAADQPAYVLREYEGKLGVFPVGAEAPARIVDFPLELLPAYDQAQLRKGVPAADEAALSRLLEDYTS